MITFKQFITEEFRSRNKKKVWKNPTKEELQEIPGAVRAFATADGNLYVANKPFTGVENHHEDLFNLMNKLWPETRKYQFSGLGVENVVSIVRKQKTSLFMVSDDEWYFSKTSRRDLSTEQMKTFHDKRRNVLRNTSKNNKFSSFKYEQINENKN